MTVLECVYLVQVFMFDFLRKEKVVEEGTNITLRKYSSLMRRSAIERNQFVCVSTVITNIQTSNTPVGIETAERSVEVV